MSVTADTLPLRRWLAAATGPTAVLVACREHAHLDDWRAPGVGAEQIVYRLEGCLADLPPAALLEILAGGAVSVTGLLDGCANASAARDVLATASRIAAAVAVDQPVHALTDPPRKDDEPPDVPLRHGRLRRRPRPPAPDRALVVLDARAMPVSRRALVGLDGTLGQLEAHAGLRLYAVVRELLGDAPVPSGLDDIPTGAALLEAPGCSSTGVCVRTCPTQALTLTVTDLTEGRTSLAPEDPAGWQREPPVVGAAAFSNDELEEFVLTVDPARCIDCGQCVAMCHESAMSRVGPLPWSQALDGMHRTLRVGLVRRCTRCGTPYRTAGELCGVCAFRTSNPFGSRLPPGFSRASRT